MMFYLRWGCGGLDGERPVVYARYIVMTVPYSQWNSDRPFRCTLQAKHEGGFEYAPWKWSPPISRPSTCRGWLAEAQACRQPSLRSGGRLSRAARQLGFLICTVVLDRIRSLLTSPEPSVESSSLSISECAGRTRNGRGHT
jgi:hypothetical protein